MPFGGKTAGEEEKCWFPETDKREERMKKTYELLAPCHFGLEAVLKKEILDLGYEISQVEDGKVTFIGDDEAICRGNMFLRTAERVLLKEASLHPPLRNCSRGRKKFAGRITFPKTGNSGWLKPPP